MPSGTQLLTDNTKGHLDLWELPTSPMPFDANQTDVACCETVTMRLLKRASCTQAVMPSGTQLLTGNAKGHLDLWELPSSALPKDTAPECQVRTPAHAGSQHPVRCSIELEL